MSRTQFVGLVVGLVVTLGAPGGFAVAPRTALAQPTQHADEPTAGISLPATPLAGDHDATSIALNPAGLVFLGGYHLELAVTGLDEDHAHAAGTGVGLYAAVPVQLPLLPRLGFGVGVEQLIPPRAALSPDPGKPLRFSFAAAYAIRADVAVGAAWRHFIDPVGTGLDDVDTFDLGLSMRYGRHWAFGAVVSDLFAPTVAGVPVQRRYQAELVSRPSGHARLELGLGGGIGERRGDLDGSLRLAWGLTSGLTLRAEVAARTRYQLTSPIFDPGDTEERHELVGSLGLEVSFGGAGAALYGTGGVDAGGDARMLGGTFIARWSGERLPSIVPRPDRIERIELEGSISPRELTRLVLRLRRMERDPHVLGVFFVFDGVSAGWGTAQELRQAMLRLRQHGKKVFAYIVAGTTREYYIAAAADQILLDAAGGVRLQGMMSTVLFFKGLFDQLGVEAQFEKIEEYKSAPEAFTMTESSSSAREMRKELFDDILAHLVADLARDRSRPEASWQAVFDGGPYTAKEAGAAGLVDVVGEPSDIDAAIGKAFEGRHVVVSDRDPAERDGTWEHPQIAVIYLDGDIVDGKSMTVPLLGQKLSGGDTIAAALTWARANPRVIAVVLRVDSPGGSALASEVIARQVKALRGVKPIIISMGDIAASGGYFAAAYGDRIFADSSTITGSIGIFSGKFDLSRMLARIGLTWETTKRGERADMESYFRSYSDDERVLLKQKLRYYYGRFVSAVATGRDLTEKEVDDVGRGHVWTGAQAKDRGLVDEIGGIADAIVYAKAKAGLGETERVEIVMLPHEPSGLLGTLLRLAGGGADERASTVNMITGLFGLDRLLRLLPASVILAPGTPQARLPFLLQLDD